MGLEEGGCGWDELEWWLLKGNVGFGMGRWARFKREECGGVDCEGVRGFDV